MKKLYMKISFSGMNHILRIFGLFSFLMSVCMTSSVAQTAQVSPISVEECTVPHTESPYTLTYDTYTIYQIDISFSPSSAGSGSQIGGTNQFSITWDSPGTATISFSYWDGGQPVSYTGSPVTTTFALTGDPGTISASATSVEYNSNITLSVSGASGSYTYQKCTSASCPTSSDTNWSTTTASQTGLTQTTKFRTKNTTCGINYSNIVTVTVYPQFTAGSVALPSGSICSGADITLSSVGDASGGKGTIRYQWESSSTGAGGWVDVSLPTADEASLTDLPITSTHKYYRRKTWSDFNENLYSNVLDLNNLTVNDPLSAGSLNSQTICYNTVPATIDGVAASGGGGGYSYEWSFSSDNVNWSPWESGGATYTDVANKIGSVTSNHYVKRRVSANCGSPLETAVMTITVQSQFTAGTLNTNTGPEYGSDITLSVSGNTGPVTYQESSDDSNWTNLASGAITNITTDTYYRAKLNDESCGIKYSSSVFVNVYPQFTAGSVALPSGSICSGADITLSSVGDASGGKGTIRYQWESSSTDTGGWIDVSLPTADEASLTDLPITSTHKYYRRKTWSDFNENLYSNVLDLNNLTVNDPLSAGSLNSQTICYNTVPATIDGVAASGGGGGYSYEWSFSSDNVNWSPWESGGATYTDVANKIGSITSDHYVKRRVSANCGSPLETAVMTITVQSQFTAGTLNTNTGPEYGSDITLSVSGNTGPVTYQESSDDSNWTNLASGAITNITTDTYYRAKLNDESCGIKYSSSVFVNVYPQFTAGSVALPSGSICSGADITLSSVGDASGGKGTIRYQWESSSTGAGGWVDVSLPTADEASLTDLPITSTHKYYRRKTWSDFNENLYSNVLDLNNLTVNDPLSAGSLNSQTLCSGQTANEITGDTPTGGGGGYTYTWQFSSDNVNWGSPIQGGITFTDVATHASDLTSDLYVRRNVTSTCVTSFSEVTIDVLDASTPICVLGGLTDLNSPSTTDLFYYDQASIEIQWGYYPQLIGANIYYRQNSVLNTIVEELPVVDNGGFMSYSWDVPAPVSGQFDLLVTDKSGLVDFEANDLEFVNKIELSVNGGSIQILDKPLDISWTGGSDNWTFQLDIFEVGNPTPLLTETNIAGRQYTGLLEGLATGTDYTIRISQNNLLEEFPMHVENCSNVPASTDHNYVKSYSARTESTECLSNNADPASSIQTIEYYDGLGRLEQSVSKSASFGSLKDIVTPVTYDEFGRQDKSWLPFIWNDDQGLFVDNAATIEQPSYYNTIYADDKDFAYSEQVYEPSPLNRVVKSAAPGAAWEKGTGNTIDFIYGVNQDSAVRILTVENNLLVYDRGFYAGGELYKTTTTDENNLELEGEIIEFKNKRDQVVLKKVKLSESAGIKSYALTYYIYDEFGNLRHVIQPEGVEEILTGDWSLVADPGFQSRWMFSYVYDDRQRMISKQVPGAAIIYMVYDKWDRLVLTQDGNQRLRDEWLFTKYDHLNRPIITGLITDNSNETTVRDSVAASAVRYETFDTNATTTFRYSNNSYPVTDVNTEFQTVTYYDNYDFITGSDLSGTTYTTPAELSTQDQFHILPQDIDKVMGKPTGTLTKVLGTNDFLTALTFYDDRYRVIQVVAENHTGEVDTINTQYDFTGNVRKIRSVYAGYGETSAILIEYTYDHMNRLISAFHTLNEGTRIELFTNEYNEVGELVSKKLFSTLASADYLQTVDYEYNIRGWLKSINKDYLEDLPSADPKDIFGMELLYYESLNTNN